VHNIAPEEGRWFSIYFSRKDIGSGVRQFLVIRVGPKFVTLFYFPRLYSFRLRRLEWDELVHIEEYIPDKVFLIKSICQKMDEWDRMRIRYAKVDAEKALSILAKSDTPLPFRDCEAAREMLGRVP
jgi:hypothetical protein